MESAQAFSERHQQVYTCSHQVQKLSDQEPVLASDYIEASATFIRHDRVGEAVADYGEYGTKIESLAQLRALGSFRAELAMLTLGRAYSRRCIQRGGHWTSGLHLLWWTKRRLQERQPPEPEPSDFRYQTAGSLERQVELASWSLMMSRLVFLSDLGAYALAEGDPVAGLHGIAEQAAAETEIPGKKRLLRWIKKVGLPMIEEVISECRYREIASALRESSALA
ncbi:hypothetical protein [Halochromatium roseum]|uniref:hypothetical protein n=1 Tax=Halochromatium roseum TaxID=391920 RepID=UPI001913E154|nr:hypothetical protein [Halochromatium roseum]